MAAINQSCINISVLQQRYVAFCQHLRLAAAASRRSGLWPKAVQVVAHDRPRATGNKFPSTALPAARKERRLAASVLRRLARSTPRLASDQDPFVRQFLLSGIGSCKPDQNSAEQPEGSDQGWDQQDVLNGHHFKTPHLKHIIRVAGSEGFDLGQPRAGGHSSRVSVPAAGLRPSSSSQ